MRTQKVGSEASPTTVTYTHDLWNRLVKVVYGTTDRAIYTYNGLNWRVSKQSDIDFIVETDPLDEKRFMFYSANWQLIEERIDSEWPFPNGTTSTSDAADIEKHQQYIWGVRYIDDIAIRRQDNNKDGDYIDTGDKTYYHCTDVQFSTVTVIDRTAKTIERVMYDEYGKARLCPPEDMDGDGNVNAADQAIVTANLGTIPAPGDVNRDGAVNASDSALVTAALGTAHRLGKLSATDNQIGWDGYVFNAEMDGGGMYTVRHRTYRVDLGRWMERDPEEYVDGMNLYEYVSSNSIVSLDPLGLSDRGCDIRQDNWLRSRGLLPSREEQAERERQARRRAADERIRREVRELVYNMLKECDKLTCAEASQGGQNNANGDKCTKSRCRLEAVEIGRRYEAAIRKLRTQFKDEYATCGIVASIIESELANPAEGDVKLVCWSVLAKWKDKVIGNHAWNELCLSPCDGGIPIPRITLDPWPQTPMWIPWMPSGPEIYPHSEPMPGCCE